MEHIIRKIAENYSGFPFDDESEEPAAQLETSYGAHEPAASEEVAWHEYIKAITELDCFTYRAVQRDADGTPTYWNALEQSYQAFSAQAKPTVYQTTIPYPAPDMIVAWCNHQRRESRT